LDEYRYRDYWARAGEAYARTDPLGAVCWDGAPPWFNSFFANQQVHALGAAMRAEFGAERRTGRALDLGCGVGRWTGWLGRWWTDTAGVDISRGMLGAAAVGQQYALADVTRLPFADRSFDCALSCVVLLHLPHEAQAGAIVETARVLRPGGRFVLLEMVNPGAPRPHLFPRRIAEWAAMLGDAGFDVVRAKGEAQAPLLRALFAAWRRTGGAATPGADPGGADGSISSIARLRGPALLAARAAVALSYPLEYVAAPLLPAGRALNVCITARKR